MTRESPLRAEPDSRLLDHDSVQQGHLFDAHDDVDEDQLLADYRQRYGLSEDPFAHDYSFPLFTGAGRRQLLDQLLHLCQFSNSLLAVLGDYGVGKTRVAHAFMDSLSDQDQICFLTLRSGQTLEQILLAIIQSFEIEAHEMPSAENLLASLEAFIAEEAVSEDDGLAVVVLDNAQLLDDHTIAVLTALLNNFPQQNRLHIALFGEPQLMQRLERFSPESLLVNDLHLPAFGLLETVEYLNFRMEMADYLGPEIFTESMVEPWWRQAPGQLNVLQGLAEEHLLQSVTPSQVSHKRPLPVAHIIVISTLIAVVAVVFMYMGDDDAAQSVNPPLATIAPANTSPIPTLTTPSPDIQAAAVSSVAPSANGLELTSTETPVQPLLQSLPQPLQPNQQVQPEQVVQPEVANADLPKEEIVPLAQLPTSQPTQSVPVPEPVQVAQPQPAPEPVKPEPVATQPAVTPPPVTQPAPKVVTVAEKPAAAVGGSEQERNILAWKPSEYTIQLLGVSTQKAARDFVAAQPNKKDLLVFKSKRQGKDWFVVITGRYANSAQARQAIASLPAAQRDAGPWQRDIKTIQNEIKSAM